MKPTNKVSLKLVFAAIIAALAIIIGYPALKSVLGDHEFKYTVLSAQLSTHCGSVRPTAGTEYLMISLTVKNLSSERHFFGGFLNGQFSVSKGAHHYDVDGRAGLAFGSAPGTYTGIEEFPPLVEKIMTVVFTVPQEIAQGTWTVKTPTDETFEVTVEQPPGRTQPETAPS
jgi:hypothetical protein